MPKFNREMLTLVPVFDAIFTERSLSRAAQRLGVTQPAVSLALGRLRKLVGDPLFENTGRGMRPTPRALSMVDDVRATIAHASAAFAPKTLDLTSLNRTFVVDIGAGFDALLLPPLAAELSLVAPGVRLLVSSARAGDLLTELRHGETQLAFDFRADESDEIRCERLAVGEPVALTRPDHPALSNGLTKDLYFKLSHVELIWARSSNLSGVAVELQRMRRQRHVAVSAPTLIAAAGVAATSDYVATMSEFVANFLAKHFKLKIHPLPFSLPPIALYQLWHSRFDDDVAHRWLRGVIRGIVKKISRPAHADCV